MKKKDKTEFNFEKFVNDIEKREESARNRVENYQKGQDENPARLYNNLYRERWQNRIKWRR